MIIQVVVIVIVITIGLLLGYAIAIHLCRSDQKKDELVPTETNLREVACSVRNNNDDKHSKSNSTSSTSRNKYDFSVYKALISKNASLESLPEYFDQESCSLSSMSSSSTYCIHPSGDNKSNSHKDNESIITIDNRVEPKRDQFLTRDIITVKYSASVRKTDKLVTIPLADNVAGEALV